MLTLYWLPFLSTLASVLWVVAVWNLRNAKGRRRIFELHHFWVGWALLVWPGALPAWATWVGLAILWDDALQHFLQWALGLRSEVEGGPASPVHLLFRYTMYALYQRLLALGALLLLTCEGRPAFAQTVSLSYARLAGAHSPYRERDSVLVTAAAWTAAGKRQAGADLVLLVAGPAVPDYRPGPAVGTLSAVLTFVGPGTATVQAAAQQPDGRAVLSRLVTLKVGAAFTPVRGKPQLLIAAPNPDYYDVAVGDSLAFAATRYDSAGRRATVPGTVYYLMDPASGKLYYQKSPQGAFNWFDGSTGRGRFTPTDTGTVLAYAQYQVAPGVNLRSNGVLVEVGPPRVLCLRDSATAAYRGSHAAACRRWAP